jgi:hypothetical protein
MDELIHSAIVGVSIFFVLLFLLPRRKSCPRCQALLPNIRWPRNVREALWGGWTCPKCKIEIGREGLAVDSSRPS